jgi:hypothetical protein
MAIASGTQTMNSDQQRAYRMLLAAGMLHVKWDLACWGGGPDWLRPRMLREQLRSARRAADRSRLFHNLAIFAASDFRGFSEELFWSDVDRFQHRFPDDRRTNYRRLYDRCMAGEDVNIIASIG